MFSFRIHFYTMQGREKYFSKLDFQYLNKLILINKFIQVTSIVQNKYNWSFSPQQKQWV